ncbi:MAG: hypothetical protein WAX04_02465 [Oscillospiraceae bacterium]
MKKLALLALLMTVVLCILVGCKQITSPSTDDAIQDSSVTTNSEVESSSIPVSSEVQSSSTPVSSEPVSSSASSYADDDPNKPVKHPNYRESIPQPSAEELATEEATQKENERLSKLPAEYTAQLEQEVYPVGTEKINLLIKNNGPGILFRSYNVGQIIEKFDGTEWVGVVATPPQTNGPDWIFPNTEDVKEYKIGKITEAGRYRASEEFCYGDVTEVKTFEFTLE